MTLLAGIGALLLAAASGTPRPGERAAEILSDGSYQATLPHQPVPAHLDLDLGWVAILLRLLLWTAAVVVVVLAAAWLAKRLARGPSDEEVLEAAPAPAAEIPIASARALAAAGRFAEAIHSLLLETLAALSRAARLSPSLTSREILARVSLPARARDALGALVVAVEISRFGGAPAGEEDYRACLERFEAFLETYRGAA